MHFVELNIVEFTRYCNIEYLKTNRMHFVELNIVQFRRYCNIEYLKTSRMHFVELNIVQFFVTFTIYHNTQ
jgi:hypothetical protein